MSDVVAVEKASKAKPAPAPRPEPVRYQFSQSLVMLSRPAESTAESLRALRTHIVAQHIELGRRALTFIGVGADVGCTFTAVNLAVALSQIGLKTLLLDSNLRSPGVDQMIIPSRTSPGLAQCLASPLENFADYIAGDVIENLSVMFAGKIVADAQTLLATQRFRTLVDFCLRDFDVTIVDTAPANSSADSSLVSGVVGYSLIVSRQNMTFVDDVKVLMSKLESVNAHVVGTILNQA
jgi:protein-tyrosine kinase